MRRLIKEWKTLGNAEFARTRGRKASNKIRAAYHKFARTTVIPSRYNVLMTANWSDTTFRFCIDAAYGYDLYNILNDYPRPFTFLDIGANQGVYSLVAGKNSQCKSVYSFEPTPRTFSLLQKNIVANNLESTVHAINAGVSDHCGHATLSIDPAHTGGATLHDTDSQTNQLTVDVELIDHNELTRRVSLIGDIVIKVDVEGHEETVFKQLSASGFASQIRLIHYEVDEQWVEPDTLKHYLENLGFNKFERFDTHRKFHYDVVARKLEN